MSSPSIPPISPSNLNQSIKCTSSMSISWRNLHNIFLHWRNFPSRGWPRKLKHETCTGHNWCRTDTTNPSNRYNCHKRHILILPAMVDQVSKSLWSFTCLGPTSRVFNNKGCTSYSRMILINLHVQPTIIGSKFYLFVTFMLPNYIS